MKQTTRGDLELGVGTSNPIGYNDNRAIILGTASKIEKKKKFFLKVKIF
jgi:hypothetical protein